MIFVHTCIFCNYCYHNCFIVFCRYYSCNQHWKWYMFILDPPEGRVFIGNATCQTRGGDPSREIVQIHCLPREAFSATTRWFFNGMQLFNTGDTLNIEGTGPGIYTCVSSNGCGTFNASTSILGTT